MSATVHDTADTAPSESFAPVVVRTSNVAQELLQTAATYKVSVHSIDFNLISVQTFSRTRNDNTSTDVDDWLELKTEEIKEISEDLLLNPSYEIKQVYEIEIFHNVSSSDPLEGFEASIAGNHTLCKIYLAIKAGSAVTYDENFELNFYNLIRKKKLRANIFIGMFDSMMKENLTELIAKIRVNGSYRFDTSERYLVAESIEPIPTINDQLIFHYDKRENTSQDERVDYANRSYISSVVENEILIEYIKPFKGTNGRNCRGVFVTSSEPVVKNEPTFTIGSNIERIEQEKNIEFRAKVGGYVTFEGGTYDIKTEMDVNEISFRSTGSIETQLDADVSIHVKEKDALKDAVGAGMDVTVNVINVEGNVGPDAKITAHKASIDGQVHSSAVVRADELNINIHKGTAYGTDVHITRLEHGVVEADRVTITQATGGKVRAKEIIIEILGSHTKLTASRLIEITKLQGGENVLIIDPLLNASKDTLEDDSRKMNEVKTVMDNIQKELTGFQETLEDNMDTFTQIKKQLIHYKQNNISAPAAYVQKYQQFQKLKEKIATLEEEYKIKKDQYTFLSSHHVALQNEIFDARIINHDRWHNHNEIVFKLIEPSIDVSHIPHEGSEEEILALQLDEDGEFTIKVVTK